MLKKILNLNLLKNYVKQFNLFTKTKEPEMSPAEYLEKFKRIDPYYKLEPAEEREFLSGLEELDELD